MASCDDTDIPRLVKHLNAVAYEWIKATIRKDPLMRRKVNQFLLSGANSNEMPTKLLAAREALAEALPKDSEETSMVSEATDGQR